MNKEILDKLDTTIKELEELKSRLSFPEEKKRELKTREVNTISAYGKYANTTGTSSEFGIDIRVTDVLDLNADDATTLLSALGNKERFEILKLLLENGCTVNQIMDKLKFDTTGKAYHHLNALVASGIVHKKDSYYRISAKHISGLLVILTGVYTYLNKDLAKVNVEEFK